MEKLCKIAETLRQYGVPEELISALDKAENEILALEEKRMFRFACLLYTSPSPRDCS